MPRKHLVEIGDLCDIDQIDDSKVLDFLRNAMKSFVHGHALRIPVMAETNYHDAIFFGFDSFVNMPARWKMGKEIRHSEV